MLVLWVYTFVKAVFTMHFKDVTFSSPITARWWILKLGNLILRIHLGNLKDRPGGRLRSNTNLFPTCSTNTGGKCEKAAYLQGCADRRPHPQLWGVSVAQPWGGDQGGARRKSCSGAWGVVERLPGLCEALGSIPGEKKRKERKQRKGRESK